MSRLRPLLFPALILGLVTLAAFGVRQVIVSQESDPLGGPDVSPTDLQRLREPAEARERALINQFIDDGGDPCSLPWAEPDVYILPKYADLPSVVNDAQLIVTAHSVDSVLERPQPPAVSGRVLTTVQVEEALKGTPPGPLVQVDSFHAVAGGTGLQRGSGLRLDPCAPGQVLLFLEGTAEPDVVKIVAAEAWARIDGDTVVETLWGAEDRLFQGYASAQDLLDTVRQIAQQQEAQGLAKGALVCRDSWSPLEVCPGDTFNPYQVLRLETAKHVGVGTTDPGPSQLGVAAAVLKPGPQLSSLLGALDVEVVVKPLGLPPDDVISITVLPAQPVAGRDSFLLEYSPSAGIVQMPPLGGQFPAPPAFQQAMEPFLAAP